MPKQENITMRSRLRYLTPLVESIRIFGLSVCQKFMQINNNKYHATGLTFRHFQRLPKLLKNLGSVSIEIAIDFIHSLLFDNPELAICGPNQSFVVSHHNNTTFVAFDGIS